MSKNETKNELPTKMTRTSLPVQQSISNAICFFCDSEGVFSKQDFVLSHLIMAILLDKQRHKWGYKTVSQVIKRSHDS